MRWLVDGLLTAMLVPSLVVMLASVALTSVAYVLIIREPLRERWES